MNKRIGIIAGNKNLPLVAAQRARREGYDVYACAIRGETDPFIENCAEKTIWTKLGQLGKVIRFFRDNEVNECFLAGKITKTNILKGDIVPDFDMVCALSSVANWKDDTLLGSICSYLDGKGIRVSESTKFLEPLLAKPMVYTKRKPSRTQLDDVEFGWHLAKEMGRLDIGQTVVVKNKAIIAVEAIEGTDEAIRRGGSLGGAETVVVKVAKPNQDMRFDVPVIGMRTLESLVAARVRVVAVEARKTLVLDERLLIDQLNREKMIFLGKD